MGDLAADRPAWWRSAYLGLWQSSSQLRMISPTLARWRWAYCGQCNAQASKVAHYYEATSLCLCLWLSASLSLALALSLCLVSVCLSVSLSLSLCVFLTLSICLSLSLSLCLSVCCCCYCFPYGKMRSRTIASSFLLPFCREKWLPRFYLHFLTKNGGTFVLLSGWLKVL